MTVVGSSRRRDGSARLFKVEVPVLDCYFSGTGDMFAALMVARLREACAERKGRLGGGRMEELVSSYHHTVADGPIRECGEDEVQCRYDGHDIVTAVLRLAGQVAKKTSSQYKKEK